MRPSSIRLVTSGSYRHTSRISPHQLAAALLLCAASATSGFGAGAQANLIISNEKVAPWSTAQFKFVLAKPMLLASGHLGVDFPPGILTNDLVQVAAFSANGDAYGSGTLSNYGQHIDIQFGSASGGIGQLPGLPILTITAPVWNGTTVPIRATASGWKDAQGNDVTVTVIPGSLSFDSTLSISQVSPALGVNPAGAVLSINGSGFTSSTQLDIEGVSLSSIQVLGPETIHATLAGPADLTGKRVRVSDPATSAPVDFYPSAQPDPLDSVVIGLLPILPLQTYSAAITSSTITPRTAGGVVVLNPNGIPADVLFQGIDMGGGRERTVTVPPWGTYFQSQSTLAVGYAGSIRVISSAPLRMLQLQANLNGSSSNPTPYIGVFPMTAVPVPSTSVFASTADPGQGSGFEALAFNWLSGSPVPKPQSITITGGSQGESVSFTVSSSGESWLKFSPSSAQVCSSAAACSPVVVSVDPTSLKPGIYRATITITPAATAEGRLGRPSLVPVALTVTNAPLSRTLVSLGSSPASPRTP